MRNGIAIGNQNDEYGIMHNVTDDLHLLLTKLMLLVCDFSSCLKKSRFWVVLCLT